MLGFSGCDHFNSLRPFSNKHQEDCRMLTAVSYMRTAPELPDQTLLRPHKLSQMLC